jgi:hypothetical protein
VPPPLSRELRHDRRQPRRRRLHRLSRIRSSRRPGIGALINELMGRNLVDTDWAIQPFREHPLFGRHHFGAMGIFDFFSSSVMSILRGV